MFEYKDSYSLATAFLLAVLAALLDMLVVRIALCIVAATFFVWPLLHRRWNVTLPATLILVASAALAVGLLWQLLAYGTTWREIQHPSNKPRPPPIVEVPVVPEPRPEPPPQQAKVSTPEPPAAPDNVALHKYLDPKIQALKEAMTNTDATWAEIQKQVSPGGPFDDAGNTLGADRQLANVSNSLGRSIENLMNAAGSLGAKLADTPDLPSYQMMVLDYSNIKNETTRAIIRNLSGLYQNRIHAAQIVLKTAQDKLDVSDAAARKQGEQLYRGGKP